MLRERVPPCPRRQSQFCGWGADGVVLDLNRKPMAQMICETELEIVPGALSVVARLACDWFRAKLS